MTMAVVIKFVIIHLAHIVVAVGNQDSTKVFSLGKMEKHVKVCKYFIQNKTFVAFVNDYLRE